MPLLRPGRSDPGTEGPTSPRAEAMTHEASQVIETRARRRAGELAREGIREGREEGLTTKNARGAKEENFTTESAENAERRKRKTEEIYPRKNAKGHERERKEERFAQKNAKAQSRKRGRVFRQE